MVAYGAASQWELQQAALQLVFIRPSSAPTTGPRSTALMIEASFIQ